MGFEPTTFCMANASDVRARSRACAQTACLQGFRPSERTRPNPSKTPNLAILAILATESGAGSGLGKPLGDPPTRLLRQAGVVVQPTRSDDRSARPCRPPSVRRGARSGWIAAVRSRVVELVQGSRMRDHPAARGQSVQSLGERPTWRSTGTASTATGRPRSGWAGTCRATQASAKFAGIASSRRFTVRATTTSPRSSNDDRTFKATDELVKRGFLIARDALRPYLSPRTAGRLGVARGCGACYEYTWSWFQTRESTDARGIATMRSSFPTAGDPPPARRHSVCQTVWRPRTGGC
jgi:hypothetical protein